MSNYTRGRALEYDAKRYFEERGYLVVRSAGSKSPVDLVCLHPSLPPLLVQCKYGVARLSKQDRERLLALAHAYNARACIVTRKPREEIVVELVDGISIEDDAVLQIQPSTPIAAALQQARRAYLEAGGKLLDWNELEEKM
ncbi:MAG: hypothetical protein KatS3mg038_3736 [Candidatus Kapaibacterium sp.]|nr:MAG: hypothetical protein KatS3mg038_3736 [Candidatus Kapabacteria bacterium]